MFKSSVVLIASAFAAASCGMDQSDCRRRAETIAKEMWSVSDLHQSGCTTNADCTSFELKTTCIASCVRPVLARSVTTLQAEMDRISVQSCAGHHCKLANECAGFELPVCASGLCVPGFADGGPE